MLEPVRITYATRRAWPSVGGIAAHVDMLAAAMPPSDQVQLLAFRVDDSWPGRADVLRPHGFEPFARGDVRTQPIVLSRRDRVELLPTAAEPALRRVLPRAAAPVHRAASRSGHAAYARVIGRRLAHLASAPDVLHVFAGGDLAGAGVRAGRLRRIPVVITPAAHPGQWDDDEESARHYRAATRVTAHNRADAATYRALGVPDERIVIHPPATPALPVGGGDAIRRRHGIAGPVVLFVGARRPYKGIDLLVTAAAIAARRLGGLTLVVAGPGDPLTARSEGPLRIVDAGTVGHEDKAAWLEAADVLSLPSEYETFGLVIAEAWSVGTPVVTSDIPALAELTATGGGGLAVSRDAGALADALASLLADPARARELGERGRRYWAAELTPEHAAARAHALYEELTAR